MALYAQKQKTECIYIFYLGWEQKTTSGCLFFFLPKLKKMRLRMNAPAISRAMVREISTSISLFVIVLKMHYSSQVKKKKKSSVLSVTGRLSFFQEVLLFLVFTSIYDSIQLFAYIPVTYTLMKYFISLCEICTSGFFCGDRFSSSILLKCLGCLTSSWLPLDIK